MAKFHYLKEEDYDIAHHKPGWRAGDIRTLNEEPLWGEQHKEIESYVKQHCYLFVQITHRCAAWNFWVAKVGTHYNIYQAPTDDSVYLSFQTNCVEEAVEYFENEMLDYDVNDIDSDWLKAICENIKSGEEKPFIYCFTLEPEW